METKRKYVVTSKTTAAKSGLGGALFAIAIIFMIASAVWCVTIMKESETLAITVLIISFLLGLCIVGISNVIKNIRISQNQKYIVEEIIEAEVNKNNRKACEIPQEVVKEELMAVLAALVKDELKKNAAAEAKKDTAAVEKPSYGYSTDTARQSVYGAAQKPAEESAYGVAQKPAEESAYGAAQKPAAESAYGATQKPAAPVVETPAPKPVTPAAKPVVQETAATEDVAIGSNEWKCRVCGRINRNYIGMCACGNHVSENNGPKAEEPAISRPSVEEAISRPSVEAAISRPSVEEAISRPSVEEAISRPSVEAAISRPSVEAAISRPSVEAAISKPSVDEVYSRPVADNYDDDDDEVLGDETASEKRVIGPVTGGANWVCKLCGRINPKFVGACECGNARTDNSFGSDEGSLGHSQSRAPEALRSTVRLTPKDNISTQPVKEEPKTPNLDFNSDDYDVAAARAAEEAAAAANKAKNVDIPMPASSRAGNSNVTQISATEWRCNVCNRVNRNYIGTCACGNSKY